MDPKSIAETVIKRLEDAWNAADGAAFGAPFAPVLASVLLVGDGDDHRIAAFHNPVVAPT